jgi:hypothetical protein
MTAEDRDSRLREWLEKILAGWYPHPFVNTGQARKGSLAVLSDFAGEVRGQEKARLRDYYPSLFIPGEQGCERCDYSVSKLTLRSSDGAVGVNVDAPLETCPNGCGPLVYVTWETGMKQMSKVAESQMKRAEAAEAGKREAEERARQLEINLTSVCEDRDRHAERARKAEETLQKVSLYTPNARAEAAEAEVARLREERDEHRRQLEIWHRAEAENRQTRAQLVDAQRQVEELRGELTEAHAAGLGLTADLLAAEARVSDLERERDEAREHAVKCMTHCEGYQFDLHKAQVERDGLKERMEALASEAEVQRIAKESWKSGAGLRDLRIEALEKALRTVQRELFGLSGYLYGRGMATPGLDIIDAALQGTEPRSETNTETVMSCGHTPSWHVSKGVGPEVSACGYVDPNYLRKRLGLPDEPDDGRFTVCTDTHAQGTEPAEVNPLRIVCTCGHSIVHHEARAGACSGVCECVQYQGTEPKTEPCDSAESVQKP